MPKWHLDNVWSEDNPNAYLPRYRGYVAISGRALTNKQTRYIQNVAYIRLKNLQIGYNLPQTLMNNLSFLNSAKIYVSGENLFSLSNLYKRTKDFDVESIGGSDIDLTSGDMGNVNNYPIMKTVSFGVSLAF